MVIGSIEEKKEYIRKKVENFLRTAKTKDDFVKMLDEEFGYYLDYMTDAHYPDDDWGNHSSGRMASVLIGSYSDGIRVEVSI